MVTKFVLKENKTNSCRHALFYKQRFFQCFFQPHCCLTFSWTKLQILLRCCLNTYLTIILLRHIFYLVYLCPCLGLGLFMSYLCDLFFIFRLIFIGINPLSANITKWSNTLKQFVGKLPTNCLSVFDHFCGIGA